MHRIFVLFALVVAALGAGCTALERSRNTADPAVSGETLAKQVCSTCHGMDGNSVSPNFPRLAGQPEPYFIAQMKGFRTHTRSDPVGFEYMWGLSRHLTDEQITGLAAYFAKQKPLSGSPGDSEAMAEGKKIYVEGIPAKNVPPCMLCHGEQGEGKDIFSRLAGQHADYLIKQMGVFQRTDERPEGSVMKEIAHGLDPQAIEQVSIYNQAM